jgi:chromate transporter
VTGVPLLDLARAWIIVATTSIGGGPAALLLIRHELVEKRQWLTQRQFLEDYALSKMGLGINLITMAGLVGSRVAGPRGIAVSVLSFVLPAAALTILLTAGYLQVRDSVIVRAALSGAGPVAAGMTAGFSLNLARQSVRRGARGFIDYGYAAAIFLAAILLNASPLVVIPLGIAVGAVLLRGEPSRASGDAAT